MDATDFLKSKGINKASYEGVRLVDKQMGTYSIVDLLTEYAEGMVKEEISKRKTPYLN